MMIGFPDHNITSIAGIVSRRPAGLKAASALILLIMIAATPRTAPLWLLLPCGLVAAIAVLGRIPVLLLLRRLMAFEVLAVTTSVLALFQPDGWHLFWTLLAKATLSLITAIVFSFSVSFMELLELLRRMRLPRLFVTTIALLYRYLFVLTDQSARMTRARSSRTFVPNKRRAWIINSGIIGSLALRSVERAENVYNAMRARGWR